MYTVGLHHLFEQLPNMEQSYTSSSPDPGARGVRIQGHSSMGLIQRARIQGGGFRGADPGADPGGPIPGGADYWLQILGAQIQGGRNLRRSSRIKGVSYFHQGSRLPHHQGPPLPPPPRAPSPPPPRVPPPPRTMRSTDPSELTTMVPSLP